MNMKMHNIHFSKYINKRKKKLHITLTSTDCPFINSTGATPGTQNACTIHNIEQATTPHSICLVNIQKNKRKTFIKDLIRDMQGDKFCNIMHAHMDLG